MLILPVQGEMELVIAIKAITGVAQAMMFNSNVNEIDALTDEHLALMSTDDLKTMTMCRRLLEDDTVAVPVNDAIVDISDSEEEPPEEEPPGLTCKTCNKVFTRRDNLLVHVNSVHLKNRVKCDQCGSHFSTPRGLNKHRNKPCRKISTVPTDPNRPIQCCMCNGVPNCLLLPCKHGSQCHECYLKVEEMAKTNETPCKCPVCRETVTGITIYHLS